MLLFRSNKAPVYAAVPSPIGTGSKIHLDSRTARAADSRGAVHALRTAAHEQRAGRQRPDEGCYRLRDWKFREPMTATLPPSMSRENRESSPGLPPEAAAEHLFELSHGRLNCLRNLSVLLLANEHGAFVGRNETFER